VYFEHDVFDDVPNPILLVTDLKLSNATSVGNGAYTLYSTIAGFPLQASKSNIAAVIGGKTYRTTWTHMTVQLPSCNA
jgi:hypothetical protein